MRKKKSTSRQRRQSAVRQSKQAKQAANKTKKSRTAAPRDAATYERCLGLLSDLRHGKGSYSSLLRKYHLNSRTARKYLGRDLLGGTGGKPVRASKSDRRVRDLLFPTSRGDVVIRTRSSRDATKLSEFFQDRDKLLRHKLSADDFEEKWSGVQVAGRELFAEAAEIFRMGNADHLKVEDLYGDIGPAQ